MWGKERKKLMLIVNDACSIQLLQSLTAVTTMIEKNAEARAQPSDTRKYVMCELCSGLRLEGAGDM